MTCRLSVAQLDSMADTLHYKVKESSANFLAVSEFSCGSVGAARRLQARGSTLQRIKALPISWKYWRQPVTSTNGGVLSSPFLSAPDQRRTRQNSMCSSRGKKALTEFRVPRESELPIPPGSPAIACRRSARLSTGAGRERPATQVPARWLRGRCRSESESSRRWV